MLDSRTLPARWKGSSTSARSDSGIPTPSSSTVAVSHSGGALEDEWIGLEMRDVQDLRDQGGEPLCGLVDAFQILPLFAGRERQVQERVRVAADERQRRPQLVADGRDERLAQLLERSDR